MMTHFPDSDVPTMPMLSEPYFVLIQDGEAVDAAQHPAALLWAGLDENSPFKVAIGVVEETTGHKEIVGVCAEFKKHGGNSFYVTSDTDGYMRMLTNEDNSIEIVKSRILRLYAMKRFSDPFNFTKVKLYQGGCMG